MNIDNKIKFYRDCIIMANDYFSYYEIGEE